VAKSISADLLTPVSAFLAVAEGEPDAFLLESVEGGEKIGRYTFLGVRPFLRLESRGAEITIERGRKVERRTGNVFEVIKELLQQHRPARWKACRPSPRAPSVIARMTSCGAGEHRRARLR
jgi:anthranilate synthase component I